MKKVQKIILIAIFFLTMFITTTILYNFDQKNNQYVVSIEDYKIPLDDYICYAKIMKYDIEEEYIDKKGNTNINDIWTSELYGMNAEQYLKEQTINKIIKNRIYLNKFNELGLELSENHIKEINEYIDSESIQKRIVKMNILEEQYIEYMKLEKMGEILSDYMLENTIITNKEANQYIQDINNANIYVIRRMIFFTRNKTTLAEIYTEDENKKIYEKAQNVYSLLESGNKFEEMALLYSDSILTYKPGDKYVFLEGTSDNKKIEEVATKLETGKYSNVFETTNGYEIIKLEQIITTEDDSYIDEIKELMMSNKKLELFDKEYEKWYKLSDININNTVINNIKII